MHTQALFLALILSATTCVAQEDAAKATPAPAKVLKKEDVVGSWQVSHPVWKGTLNIRADGTFLRLDGDGGKWELQTDKQPTVLKLNWDQWKSESVTWLPPNRFRGKIGKGVFELRRIPAVEDSPPKTPADEPERLPEFENKELSALLSDSQWSLRDGKRFTFHADGTSTGTWHRRKGFWRIIGPDQVQLRIGADAYDVKIVTVEKKATILRWSDEDWGTVAKRFEPPPDKR